MSQVTEVRNLRLKRRTAFVKKMMPYVSYAIRSGLGAVIGILCIVGAAYYSYMLQLEVPIFDYRWLCGATIFLVLIICPVRTFIQKADLLYMLPLEHVMIRNYFPVALRRSWFVQLGILTLVWIILFPLLERHYNMSIAVGCGIWGILIVYKSLLLLVRWRANQWEDERYTVVERWGRLAVAAVGVLPIWYTTWKMVPLVGSVALLYAVLSGYPKRHRIHWQRVVQQEERTVARWLHFFNWFVDVESIQNEAKRRKSFDLFTRIVPYGKQSAFEYLYIRVLLRTELLGTVVRLVLVGMVCVSVLQGWLVKLVAYGLFAWLSAVQLRSLQQAHVHSEWMHVYPLPDGKRTASIYRLILIAHIVILLCLSIPLVYSHLQWLLILPISVGLSWFVHGKKIRYTITSKNK